MSADPTELNSLIPQHFLSRRPLTVFPDLDVVDIKTNLLSCLLLQAMYRHSLEQWQVDHSHDLDFNNITNGRRPLRNPFAQAP